MSYFQCSKCGCTKFKSYPQTIPTDGREWDYEYYCANCGKMMILTRAREEEEEEE
ncbi:MAG: hypothetical protein IJT54_05970 [Candidatus Methanomethylophilaceae archaeon]|nr:hypothetical protein [Candidatus Methanomethylophilaceae archaeon]